MWINGVAYYSVHVSVHFSLLMSFTGPEGKTIETAQNLQVFFFSVRTSEHCENIFTNRKYWRSHIRCSERLLFFFSICDIWNSKARI